MGPTSMLRPLASPSPPALFLPRTSTVAVALMLAVMRLSPITTLSRAVTTVHGPRRRHAGVEVRTL